MRLNNYSFNAVIAFILISMAVTTSFDAFPTPVSSDIVEDHMIKEELDALIDREKVLDGALIGVSIRSATTGNILYEHMGDIRLRPASNMKLLTGAVALATLGEGYTFTTEILADGDIKNGQLNGNLYLKGKGDPTLLVADFDAFAKDLQKSGLKVIDGDIIGDDTWYDDVRLSPDLIWNDESYYYGAQVSALTAFLDDDYDTGTITVEVGPGNEVGDKAIVTVLPKTDYMTIKNKTSTDSADNADLIIEREHGKNTISIEGTISLGSGKTKESIAVWDPTGYAMDLFQQALTENGIVWTGKVKRGEANKDTVVLHAYESMPLSELIIPFMKLSNNGHAEMLVKEMGKVVKGEGSWEKGLEVMSEELLLLGIDTSTVSIRDGSGLSHLNLIPANEISNFLYAIQDMDWFPKFINSLPITGSEDKTATGTLRNRLEDLVIQAKTGKISGVTTLSGYLEQDNGEDIIFSVMVNNILDENKGIKIVDLIMTVIADSE